MRGTGDEGTAVLDADVQREGSDLAAIWALHERQRRGDFARRRMRRGIIAPGLLLAANTSVTPAFVDALLAKLNASFNDDSSRPFFEIPLLEILTPTVDDDGGDGGVLNYFQDSNSTRSQDFVEEMLATLNMSANSEISHRFVDLPIVEVLDRFEAHDREGHHGQHESRDLPDIEQEVSASTTLADEIPRNSPTEMPALTNGSEGLDARSGDMYGVQWETWLQKNLAQNGAAESDEDSGDDAARDIHRIHDIGGSDEDGDEGDEGKGSEAAVNAGISEPTLDEDAWGRRSFDVPGVHQDGIHAYLAAHSTPYLNAYSDPYSGAHVNPYADGAERCDTVSENIALNASLVLALTGASASANAFDAAISSVPSMRCRLRAAYWLARRLLADVAAQALAHHRATQDATSSITLADLDNALDAVSGITQGTTGGMTGRRAQEGASSPASPALPEVPALPISGNGTSVRSKPAGARETHTAGGCRETVEALASDRSFRSALLDEVRADVRRTVTRLNDAVTDLYRHGWTVEPEETNTTWLSLAHIAEAALGAYRQIGLASNDEGQVNASTSAQSQSQAQAWADQALVLLSGEPAAVRENRENGNPAYADHEAADHGSAAGAEVSEGPVSAAPPRGSVCPSPPLQRSLSFRRAEMRQRVAANLLVMRFVRSRGIGLDDTDFLGKLLTGMVTATATVTLDPDWDAVDRLPTAGALSRYGLRLMNAYENERLLMQSIAFMPMKYYRTQCYEEHFKRERMTEGAGGGVDALSWTERLQSSAYRRCFFNTADDYRDRYHRQFSVYREKYAERHVRYLVETLLQLRGIHPLTWRAAGRVYDMTYTIGRKKFRPPISTSWHEKQPWQARAIMFDDASPLIVCQDGDDWNGLNVSTLAARGACQQQLDVLTAPQRFTLTGWLALATPRGHVASGWRRQRIDAVARWAHRLAVTLRTARSLSGGDVSPAKNGTESGGAVSNIARETMEIARPALRDQIDSFEKAHYTPDTVEWLLDFLPFYGAIEKERSSGDYRVDWRRAALDTAEVIMVLTLFGLPAKALSHAALRAGRAAIRFSRRARLLPLTRAYRVLRGVLPYLRGAGRSAGQWGARVTHGMRRGSEEVWRLVRRAYWGRASRWRLRGRARANALPPEVLDGADQVYLARISARFRRDAGMRAMIDRPAGMCYDAAALGRDVLGTLADRVMYRGVLIWRRGATQPANHIALVVRRHGQNYVLDPTAAQFSRFSSGFDRPLYLPEARWRAVYQQGFYNEVVKFADFRALVQTERLFGVVPRSVGDSLPSTTTLVAPSWYRGAGRG